VGSVRACMSDRVGFVGPSVRTVTFVTSNAHRHRRHSRSWHQQTSNAFQRSRFERVVRRRGHAVLSALQALEAIAEALGSFRTRGRTRRTRSTKVVRSGLQNAASIASLLLTTEAAISQIPEKHQNGAASAGGMGSADMY